MNEDKLIKLIGDITKGWNDATEKMVPQEKDLLVDSLVFLASLPLNSLWVKRALRKRGAPEWVVYLAPSLLLRGTLHLQAMRRAEKQAIREQKRFGLL